MPKLCFAVLEQCHMEFKIQLWYNSCGHTFLCLCHVY